MIVDVVGGILLAGLTLYAALGGADFGGGVWHLLASGPRRQAQRDAISDAIGPVWESNHVWLIFALVTLFTCFPPAYADICTYLNAPLTLALLGIVLRGAAFVFRNYASDNPVLARSWSVSPDGTRWTFRLRPGMRFSDGTPVDAAAVKFNFDRWRLRSNPAHGDFTYSYYADDFGGFPGAIRVASSKHQSVPISR